MSDLIRRKDVIKLVNQFVFGVRKEQIYEAKKTFIKYIEKMPTAYDVVLVEDMKEQIGASGEHMDNKLREWIKRLERGGVK